ncbi:MAG: trehalose-phosphatase [Ilumatobacteraceae bacterium]
MTETATSGRGSERPHRPPATESFDDPLTVAAEAAALERPLLVGLDVDGVLAPIVVHADDAELLPGVLEAIGALADRTPVAIVSGRTVEDLSRFGFPDVVDMFGLHGLERRDEREVELEVREQRRLERLAALADAEAALAGDGAWVELKPAGVVLHVREAHPEIGARSAELLAQRAADVTGAHIKPGHGVVELLCRSTSKATAMAELQREYRARHIAFVGDDRTDEEVFAAIADDGCSIRVGPGPTAAQHRLAGPPEVLAFLTALANAF